MAQRVGIDTADAVSLTAQAWCEHPDCWVIVAYRRCVEWRRNECGRPLPGRTPHPPPVPVSTDDLPAFGADDPGFAAVEDRDELLRLLRRLPPREALVICEIDLRGRTGVAVAADLGVTPSRVSQLHTAGLQHARDLLTT